MGYKVKEMWAKAFDKYNEGYTITDISNMLNVSQPTVRRWIDYAIKVKEEQTKEKMTLALIQLKRARLNRCLHCQWRKDGLEICCLPRCFHAKS